MPDPLQVVIVAGEVFPYAHTGGLGDVLGLLPKEIESLGHHVTVIMPYYRSVKKGDYDISKFPNKIVVQFGDKFVDGGIARAKITPNIDIYFIVKDEYYDREGLYQDDKGEYKDNAERFIFFSKAILALLEEFAIKPDILHLHDWHTGLVPALLKTVESKNAFFETTKTIFTMHNLKYQGLFWHYDMHMTNLPWEVFTPEGIEFYGKMNFLKSGIVYSDIVTTVSQKYAMEIQTEEFGCGLEGILQKKSDVLYGVLNGVDYQCWNPAIDSFISAQYSPEKMDGKQICKKALFDKYVLKVDDDTPLFIMICRLVEQKGLDILLPSLKELINKDIAFMIMGMGEEKYMESFHELEQAYPDRIRYIEEYDRVLVHQMLAGADFVLMPSHFEPCGLTQIYGLKYGAVPIVRAVGGLDDSIEHFDRDHLSGNGFKFDAYSEEALLAMIRNAIQSYKDTEVFTKMRQNAMLCDFSWKKSASQYADIYYKAKEL